MITRKGKIDLLRKLYKGELKLEELFPDEVVICINTDGTIFKNKNTGRVMTEPELMRFKEVINKSSKIKFNVNLIPKGTIIPER
ncbi:MAG: hypothetical protein JNL49_05960 [Bacteroidia bacterium]|nr:hypothetical protein [Bacteroidia bacterium]